MTAALPRIGFFAVPKSHWKTLAKLHERWREASITQNDEYELLRNELYDRAVELCDERRELPLERASEACFEVTLYLGRLWWRDDILDRFAPDEAPRYADALRALEDKLGEDSIARRISQRGPRLSGKIIRPVYQAFRDVLQRAGETGAGFVWAVHLPEAQARLDELQARRARLQAEYDAMTPEEQAGESRRALERLMERSWQLKQEAMQRELPRMGDNPRKMHAQMCLIDDGTADTLAAMCFAIAADADEAEWGDAGADLYDQARFLALDRAEEVTVLQKMGETDTVQYLLSRLVAGCSDWVRRPAVLSSAEVRDLAENLDTWVDQQGGRDAAMDHMVEWIRLTRKPRVKAGHRALKRVVADAVARNRALAVFYRRIRPDEPLEPPAPRAR